MLENLPGRRRAVRPSAALSIEALESRNLPSVTSVLSGGVLTITGTPDRDNLRVALDDGTGEIVVHSFVQEIGRFHPTVVSHIVLDGGAGRDLLNIDSRIGIPTTILGGAGNDKLRGGTGPTTFAGEGGSNLLFDVQPIDTVVPGEMDQIAEALPVPAPEVSPVVVLYAREVERLLLRAAGASASEDAIITIVDRNGRLLGIRVEGGLDPGIQGDWSRLVFAVDGSLALARTGAFFASNQGPLTSRTVQFISQTTITQREVESYPSITDLNSTLRGPGFVSAVGIRNHFPPGVPFTPQVDLFAIEHTNRDSILFLGADGITGTADDVTLPGRFNIGPGDLAPGVTLYAPESYGLISGFQPGARARGIGTLPGGIPIYKNGQLVGGIGVFFPGKTGFATEENWSESATFDPSKPDRTLEAEYIAFAAVGGAPGIGAGVGDIAGVPPLEGFAFPLTEENQRIDLVGITLDIVGPGGLRGPQTLLDYGRTLAPGDPESGDNYRVDPSGVTLVDGLPVAEGWLVPPRDGVGVTAAEVRQVIEAGITQANETRAAIRLPLNSTTRMVFAVSDLAGNIVGLFRMPDATVFSIDVAVAKARNVAYYASDRLQPADQVAGVAEGTAFTNRSFRYLTLPRYPEGIDGLPPGPFSILTDGGVDPRTGLNVGPPLPASAYQSVQGYDAFNPGTNFRDPLNPLNQNGIVFFPGSAPMYRSQGLVGGFGVSGDGVDQDDVVTVGGIGDLGAPISLRVDQVFIRGVRVPYHKFNRNPEGGVV